MSDGHAHDLNEDRSSDDQGGGDGPAPPVTLEWYEQPAMRPVLASRDITALYQALKDTGVTHRQIAALTGQSQSEVCEILAGRRVLSYDVLVRIAEGFGIPRERMGLSYGEPGAYGEDSMVANPEEVAEMLRRHVLALGAIAAFGGPAVGGPAVGGPAVGELLAELSGPSPVPLPSQLSEIHVASVRDLTRRLGEAGNTSVSDPDVISAAAAWASRLLKVSGTEPLKRALRVAVAELHIQAGWSGFDADLYDRAMYHYARALELATEAGDAYWQALALNYAGLATVEHGPPNDGLKMLQLGEVKVWDIPPDDQRTIGEYSRAAVEACARVDSATALARLGHPEAANTALAKSRELWQPSRADPYGDLDRPAACLEMERGRLDAAEQFATASVRRWEGGSELSRTQSAVVLATVHVRAGEPDGLQLAHRAVTAASRLTSVRVRHRLVPLVEALEARSGGDHRELARMARQVAATRA